MVPSGRTGAALSAGADQAQKPECVGSRGGLGVGRAQFSPMCRACEDRPRRRQSRRADADQSVRSPRSGSSVRAARQVVVEKDNSSEVTTRSFCLREGFVGLARAEASWLTAAGHRRGRIRGQQVAWSSRGLEARASLVFGVLCAHRECGPACAGSS